MSTDATPAAEGEDVVEGEHLRPERRLAGSQALRDRHRAVENLRRVTATLIADDVVDGVGVTAALLGSYKDLRTAERRLHDNLMTSMLGQGS